MAQSLAWSLLQEIVRGKKILMFGLGLQGGGVGAANTLVRAGALVRATDSKSELELKDSLNALDPAISGTYGRHEETDVQWADIIIKNPGVPYDHSLLKTALSQGKLVTTETALALQCMRDQAIGITGTRGKTTTTTLIHHLLQTGGRLAVLCGNIPDQPTIAALEGASDDTIFVVEISSFHIEGCLLTKVSPRHAVVTNVFPDHLNRYSSLETYARVKAALFAFQKPGDEAYWGTQHEWTQLLEHSTQPGVKKHPITPEDIAATRKLSSQLPGEHNVENVAIAVAVARSLGVGETDIENGVASFTGVPYRQQLVAQKNGVRYINDTTSTTPIALEKALDAQSEPFVLICGGTTKHLPFSAQLLDKLRRRPAAIVFLDGSGTKELRSQLGELNQPQNLSHTLAESVAKAQALARLTQAKSIVFSPGFSSFELFDNEFDRGDQFNQLVTAQV